jgi:hypothetical protein
MLRTPGRDYEKCPTVNQQAMQAANIDCQLMPVIYSLSLLLSNNNIRCHLTFISIFHDRPLKDPDRNPVIQNLFDYTRYIFQDGDEY